MSVLVQSLINNHHHHPHSTYFGNNSSRRLHGNPTPAKQARQAISKVNETEQTNDHVPYGVVNSMKQRLLDKFNESLLLNNSAVSIRHALSKPASNENLLQSKPGFSSLKQTTRLSRSQDNLTHHQPINALPAQHISSEQFTSYIQPKQDVIIIESSTNDNDRDEDVEEKLHTGQKTLSHRQPYTELLVDEAPKPGTVTTVKNMFERQIRLSRYDADKLFNTSTPCGSRMSSQHRELASPARSRSVSPNEAALRQRRTIISVPIVPLASTTLSLPTPASYPDLVISHTPPTETTKSAAEQVQHETVIQGSAKEKKISIPIRHSAPHEQVPLSVVIIEESLSSPTDLHQPHLLLPSISSSSSSSSSSSAETVDSQPLDFKSRLALFNRTNTRKSSDTAALMKKHPIPPISSSTNAVPKAVVHQPVRAVQDGKQESVPEMMHEQLLTSISRSVINTAKAVTFFGGDRIDRTTKSSLPSYIPAPPPPTVSSSQASGKSEQSSVSTSADALRAPDIIGGNVKLNKSSIFSGARKEARVQFVDNVDTFEYPSFEVAMAELGSTGSDNDNEMDDDDDAQSNNSNGDRDMHGQANNQHEESTVKINGYHQDTNDDELEQLARINATYNASNLADTSLKPKGTLHTFRPTHLDQYELGTQHGSPSTTKPSDTSSSTISYSILARQKLLSSSDISSKTLSNHPILKYSQKPMFDMANNIQWSSMSTTTDLLF